MDCLYPMNVKNPKTGLFITVPCGVCISCRIAKVREWSVRLMQEASCWNNCSFITLTYENDKIPTTACGKYTLLKSELQKFFKRLRKALPSPTFDDDVVSVNGELVRTIKYFGCGEYGENPVDQVNGQDRPHYHAIVFGLKVSEQKLIQSCWKNGFVTISYVTPERCRYVCGYVQKKIRTDKKEFLKEYGCRVPPFQLISQGLGFRYFEKFKDEYLDGKRNSINGISYSFPRYYSKKCPELKLKLQLDGIGSNLDHLERVYSVSGLEWQDSEKQREMNLKAKINLKKRNI